jgi:hypothetical protein
VNPLGFVRIEIIAPRSHTPQTTGKLANEIVEPVQSRAELTGRGIRRQKFESVEAQATKPHATSVSANLDFNFMRCGFREKAGCQHAVFHPRSNGQRFVIALPVATRGVNFCDFALQQESPKIKAVHGDFHQDTSAALASKSPFRVLVRDARAVPDGTDGFDSPERAVLDQAMRFADKTMKTHVKADHGFRAGLAGLFAEPIRLIECQAKRFFNEQMFAGL